jgi:hypothetical protein
MAAFKSKGKIQKESPFYGGFGFIMRAFCRFWIESCPTRRAFLIFTFYFLLYPRLFNFYF